MRLVSLTLPRNGECFGFALRSPLHAILGTNPCTLTPCKTGIICRLTQLSPATSQALSTLCTLASTAIRWPCLVLASPKRGAFYVEVMHTIRKVIIDVFTFTACNGEAMLVMMQFVFRTTAPPRFSHHNCAWTQLCTNHHNIIATCSSTSPWVNIIDSLSFTIYSGWSFHSHCDCQSMFYIFSSFRNAMLYNFNIVTTCTTELLKTYSSSYSECVIVAGFQKLSVTQHQHGAELSNVHGACACPHFISELSLTDTVFFIWRLIRFQWHNCSL